MHSVGLVGLDTVTESLSWAEHASSEMMFTYKKSCVAFSAFKGFFLFPVLVCLVSLFFFFFLLPPSPRPPGGRWDPVRDKRQENPSLEVFNLTEITNKLTMSMALIFQMLRQYHQTMCRDDFRTFKVIALDSLTQSCQVAA